MKNLKLLTRKRFRLLALILCLTASIPQLQAAMYIVGDAPFGGWKTNKGMQMTQSGTSYTATAAVNGTIYFVFATQLCSGESDWSTFNNYRLGAQQYNQNVTVGNTYYTQAQSGNSFQFNGDGSNYLFTYNTSNNSFIITKQPAQTYEYTFYVYTPNGTPPFLYIWNNGELNGGWPGTQIASNSYEILADGNKWYKFTANYTVSTVNAIVDFGQGQNQTNDINSLTPGTHYIRWDGQNHTDANVTQTPPTAPTPNVVYYVKGSDTNIFPNGWNSGANTAMEEDTNVPGTYGRRGNSTLPWALFTNIRFGATITHGAPVGMTMLTSAQIFPGLIP